MSTIDSQKIVERLIRNGGYYDADDIGAPDNPRADEIVEYQNAFGATTWGVGWETDPDPERYRVETQHVRNPKVIWTSTGVRDFADSDIFAVSREDK